MASTGGKVTRNFREKFSLIHKEAVHWFPGHMRKGLVQMKQRLKNIDCVIEVHDARIPLTGRFTEYRSTVSGLKPHIFVLNKMDLADRSRENDVRAKLQMAGLEHILFTDFRNQQCHGMRQILPLAKKLIMDSHRFNRSENEDYALMIIGVPNVGKSSLINRLRNKYLRKGNATCVGAIAGITRSVLTRIKISEKPPVYLFDTPGILEPQVRDIQAGFKLAAVGCLQDHLVGAEIIADYLLYWLNKQKRFEYVNKLELPNATDDILELLTLTATKLGKTKKIKDFDGRIIVRPDYTAAANHFLKMFRTGEMGLVCLDDDLLNNHENT